MFLDKKASRAIGTSYSRCGCRLPPIRRCKAVVNNTRRLLKEIENIKQKQLTYKPFAHLLLTVTKKQGLFKSLLFQFIHPLFQPTSVDCADRQGSFPK